MGLLHRHRRRAVCTACGKTTEQTLHGYDLDGKLWKGHACACRGWHCTSCKAVTEKKGQCCR